jgi:hypothetical protein
MDGVTVKSLADPTFLNNEIANGLVPALVAARCACACSRVCPSGAAKHLLSGYRPNRRWPAAAPLSARARARVTVSLGGVAWHGRGIT